MLIDTHAHVNFKDFEDDYKEVMKRAHDDDVVVINVGTQVSTSKRAAEMAQEMDKTFAAVGIHPIQLHSRDIQEEHTHFRSRAEDFDHAVYQELARMDGVVAIGECGLDYYHIAENDDVEAIKVKQKKVLNQQVDLANEEKLPLIVHSRGSRENFKDSLVDTLALLLANMPQKKGVLHSFGGDWALAQDFIKQGFYIGFNGIVTFDKTGRTEEIIREMPLDRLLLETDCPYLTPVPHRGKRNEPAYVRHVAEKVAEIREISVEEVKTQTSQNAKNLFSLVI